MYKAFTGRFVHDTGYEGHLLMGSRAGRVGAQAAALLVTVRPGVVAGIACTQLRRGRVFQAVDVALLHRRTFGQRERCVLRQQGEPVNEVLGSGLDRMPAHVQHC